MKLDRNKSLKVVDLFAGCGGLSLGLEDAGFYPVFVNELSPDARQTYIDNRIDLNPLLADPRFHEADVKAMVAKPSYLATLKKNLKAEYGIEHGELDLLVGGPPCQGFSGIGHRRSYSVEKEQLPSNHLFQDMAAIIHRLQPRAFLFENVRGLLFAKWRDGGEKGDIWEEVKRTFRRIRGYKIAYKLVYARDYGVPQNRPRVLLVGIRNDVKSELLVESDSEDAYERGFLPLPVGDAPNLSDLLGDLIDPDYLGKAETTEYPKAAEGIQKDFRRPRGGGRPLPQGAPLTEHEYSRHSDRVYKKFQLMLAGNGEIPAEYRTKKFAQRVLPPAWGAKGPSITATSLPDDYVHFEQPRILTVREWARLQMFPDWYRFRGPRSTGGIRRAGNPREGIFDREVPKYTQIGNAVPVGLARAVGGHLAKILA